MFNFDDGEIWVHSVTHRPALDIVSAALFAIGVVLVVVRYIRNRHWLDLFLLVSIPLLLMPSILSLAFPGENPALNRAGGAYIPAFLIGAMALDGLATAIGLGKPALNRAEGRRVCHMGADRISCCSCLQGRTMISSSINTLNCSAAAHGTVQIWVK